MILSSLDILYLVLAFAVLWLTFFITWALYYIVQMLKGTYEMFNEVRRIVDAIDRFVEGVTGKLDKTAAAAEVLVEGVTKVAGFLTEKRNQHAAPQRKKVLSQWPTKNAR